MLVSFTGAQSTGKSTLLDECKGQLDGEWRFIPEVTRLVKRRHNVNINELGTDKTQNYILEAHIVNVLNYDTDNRVHNISGHVLDRCSLDGMVYTQYLYNHGQVKRSTLDYSRSVCNMLIDKYDIIFYTDSNIPIVDDGERSIDVNFRDEIVDIFKRYIALDSKRLDTKIRTLSGTVDQRMKIVLDTINNEQEATT